MPACARRQSPLPFAPEVTVRALIACLMVVVAACSEPPQECQGEDAGVDAAQPTFFVGEQSIRQQNYQGVCESLGAKAITDPRDIGEALAACRGEQSWCWVYAGEGWGANTWFFTRTEVLYSVLGDEVEARPVCVMR
jgi:hypothetical protein